VKKNLTHLQKDRFAYVREFFDRIEEIRYIQKRLWKLMEDNPDKPILQKSCLSELHQSTILQCDYCNEHKDWICLKNRYYNYGFLDEVI
jgi:hypothetical protein